MSAPTPQRQPGTKRPFVVPLAAALVMLTLVREGLPRVWEGASNWVVFVTALVAGYGAYAGTEWLLVRRQRQQHRGRQP